MMYLIPEPVATTKSSPSPYHQEKASQLSYSKSPSSSSSHRRRYVSSDEEDDDSRDRQSHWKRIKTRSSSDDYHQSTRTLSRCHHGRSPPRSRVQPAPLSTNTRNTERDHGRSASLQAPPRPGHRVIELKGSADAGVRRCSSGSKGGDGTPEDCMLLRGDGGTASSSQGMDPKYESMMMMMSRGSRSSSSMMCERSMKHMARRGLVEKGYEAIRVSGREVGASVSLEDSHHADDDACIPARMGSDFRQALSRQSQGETMNRTESRDRFRSERGSQATLASRVPRRVEFDLSNVGNGLARDLGRPSRSGTDENGRSARAVGAAAGGVEATKEAMESERRQEKRERWAEKERDLQTELEKENLPKPPVTTTVVDYSLKFTLAKAPISAAAKPVEVDPHRLCQRQKQIDYGKNTLGYERYTESVPRYQRTKAHPRTPDIRQVCSKRSWDGQIRKWRRLLHEYDPPKGEDEEDPDLMFAPLTKEHDRSPTRDDNSLVDMQSAFVEDPDLKIYDGWSDDEC